MTCKERRLLKQAIRELNNIDQKHFGYLDILSFEKGMKKLSEILEEDAKQ